MAIGSGIFVTNYAKILDNGFTRKASYLYSGTSSIVDPALQAVMTYGQYFILLNTIIPISLIVSLEFVKLLQTPFIAHDVKMFDVEDSLK
jgi:magnesium-transporting ATPase (P-type)